MNKKFIQSVILTISICLFLIIIGWWQQTKIALPNFSDNTLFFISTTAENNGQIIASDNGKNINISPKNWAIDQFVLWQKGETKKIFFIGKNKTDVEEKKVLFERDLQSGKTVKIIDQSEFLLQKIFLHPKRKWLLVEKNNRRNYTRSVTMWDINNKKESPIPITKSWVNFSFSPDGQTIVGLDTSKEVGFELSNFWQRNNTETVLGNFLQNFGFSPNGKNILFSQKKDNDIFAQTTDLVLYKSDGTKQTIFSANGINSAVWINQRNILVASYDQNFEYKIHIINLAESTNNLIYDFKKTQVLSISNNKNSFYISTKKTSLTKDDILGEDYFSVYQWQPVTENLEKISDNAFGLQTF